jgi:hypothetical protein
MKNNRLIALIRRAVDAGSSEEERRTCGVIACQIIVRDGLLDTMAQQASAPPTRSTTKWVRIKSKFSGTCVVCFKRYEVGAEVLWRRGIGSKHVACAK